ncbi:DinB family protein [Bryobacter aggregatus]|uniref:DinB family protein n=1 Tax=Bryobacter aggregatus TaxID=360054 RepID=UPI0004E1C117|nr:DinB family protein [Bryobacter aggregatus]
MTYDLQQSLALLTRFPRSLQNLLSGLPEGLLLGNEGEGTWTPRQILAHLIHCEKTDWMPRVKFVLEFGESQTMRPVERLGEPNGASIEELLEEFVRARAASLEEFESLGPLDLERRGVHPAFGSVTLGQLIATWAVHDLTHLHQLSRVIAVQHREAVGPWAQYLGVLHCLGRS